MRRYIVTREIVEWIVVEGEDEEDANILASESPIEEWNRGIKQSDILRVNSQDETYSIIRHYFDTEIESEVIETGLTLDEAQAHCTDPETSSSTATSQDAVARTETYGPWFDGYERD